MFTASMREVTHVDEAYAYTLHTVLADGYHVVSGHPPLNPIAGFREIIDYQIVIQQPRDRILINPARTINIVGATARLVWMIAANNRIEDIAFYEPKVSGYTDNGLTVPGSDYGMRIFEPRPGLNQIQGVVRNLQENLGSRRAATVIWSPEDAGRTSNDIPCAFGTYYHIRQGRLIATTLMRSNNAFILFPYNVFEFSILAEMLAATIGVDLGPYVHLAGSMHVYDSQAHAAELAVATYRKVGDQIIRNPMPPMPAGPPPFEQAAQLARLEAHLRHEYATLSIKELLLRGDDLHTYWRAFYHVLLAFALSKASRAEAKVVAALIPDYLPQPKLEPESVA